MTLQRTLLLVFTLLSSINGVLAVWLVSEILPDSADDVQRIAAYLGLGVVIQAFLAFSVIQKIVLLPLKNLADAAHAMASGRTAVLDIDRDDEVGQVANAINYMTESLRTTSLHTDGLIRRAVDETKSALKEKAFADRLVAAGRVAISAARHASGPLAKLADMANASGHKNETTIFPGRTGKPFVDSIVHSLEYGIHTSRRDADVRATGVCEPLRQAVELLELVRKRRNIEIEMDFEGRVGATDPIVVMADPDDLCHVFYNLVENAIEAMPHGGRLAIKAQRVYSWAVVEITDTGVGMTVENVAASFEFFHTTKTPGNSQGLGLPLARHIVLGLGGSLTLNSLKGKGTRSAVELPLATSTTTVRRRPSRLLRKE